MARGKTRAKFPQRPAFRAPDVWLSVDPASGRKDSVGVVWHRTVPVEFTGIRHDQIGAVTKAVAGRGLVVVEGGGFVGHNAASALALERVRERFACAAWFRDVPTVEVSPDQWRSVLELAARPRRQAVAAQRALCRILAKPGSRPGLELARQATNDDRRAALLIGVACCQAWEWI